MTDSGTKKGRILILFLVLVYAFQACVMTALADDPETLKLLPGDWTLYQDTQEEEDQAQQKVLAVLSFLENGKVTLRTDTTDAEYTCEGTWAFQFVEDSVDRLTIVLTSTDNPAHAGEEYRVESMYGVYTESWLEETTDTQYTALILEPDSSVSLFTELWGYEGAALYRIQGPNMRVVKCKEFVSLRKKRSTSAARIAKVPLGALVLAFPEAGEENGFIWCVYQGQYGYILAEYLQPAE